MTRVTGMMAESYGRHGRVSVGRCIPPQFLAQRLAREIGAELLEDGARGDTRAAADGRDQANRRGLTRLAGVQRAEPFVGVEVVLDSRPRGFHHRRSGHVVSCVEGREKSRLLVFVRISPPHPAN